ncbi:hypothetical protein [Streptomyces sp. NPDC055060]
MKKLQRQLLLVQERIPDEISARVQIEHFLDELTSAVRSPDES